MKNSNKHKWVGYFLLALPLSIACTNEKNVQSLPAEQLQVNIHSSSHIQTRVQNNQFEKNDAIGLFLLQQPNKLTDSRHADNIAFQFSGSAWTSEQPLYYPNNSDLCDFIAYYPYQSEGIPAASSNLTWHIAANQSQPKEYAQSDLLVAERLSVTPSAEPVNLIFKHKLAEVCIELEYGNGFNSAEELLAAQPVVTILGTSLQGDYNLSTREISNYSQTGNITPAGTFSISGNKLIGQSAIVLPQTIAGDKPFIEVKANEKTFVFTFGESHTIQPATRETYTLTLQKAAIQGTITPEISDWENSSSIQGSLHEEENKTDPTPDTNSYSFTLPDFSQSAIYQITTTAGTGLEICKEYLHASNIDSQAIVAYPLTDGKADLTQGHVLQVLDGVSGNAVSAAIHGGKVSWESTNNTLSYQAGNSKSQNTFFFNTKDGITSIPQRESTLLVANPVRLKDSHNENSYPIVKIATQYWMQSELKATQTRSGKLLTQAGNASEWNKAVDSKTLAYAIKDGYQYYTNAVAKSDIAPEGWEIPTNSDWQTLIAYINNNPSLVISWGENKTGFSASPTGYRKKDGTYSKTSQSPAYYWSTDCNMSIGNTFSVGYTVNEGDCIRCIRR